MKKAILVVSFGTSYKDALKNSIEKIENRIKEEFKDYDVFRAFTAHMIIRKINERDNLKILTPEEAFDNLKENGYEEVIVQPLHVIPGEEFDYIKGVVENRKNDFSSIKLGRPIFYYQGMQGLPKDYSLFVESIREVIENEESVILFGHGTSHPANAVYGMLQSVLVDDGFDNVFVATIEGYPTIESVVRRIKNKGIKNTKLVPLLLVAGEHVKKDMLSTEEDSLRTSLEREGVAVSLHMKGLGEIDKFDELYINRIYDSIENRYLDAGKTKKLRHK